MLLMIPESPRLMTASAMVNSAMGDSFVRSSKNRCVSLYATMVETNKVETSIPNVLKSGYCNAKIVAPKTFRDKAAFEAKLVKADSEPLLAKHGAMATSRINPKTGAKFPKTVLSDNEQ